MSTLSAPGFKAGPVCRCPVWYSAKRNTGSSSGTRLLLCAMCSRFMWGQKRFVPAVPMWERRRRVKTYDADIPETFEIYNAMHMHQRVRACL